MLTERATQAVQSQKAPAMSSQRTNSIPVLCMHTTCSFKTSTWWRKLVIVAWKKSKKRLLEEEGEEEKKKKEKMVEEENKTSSHCILSFHC